MHTGAARTNHVYGGILHALNATTRYIAITGAAGTLGPTVAIVYTGYAYRGPLVSEACTIDGYL